MISFIPVLKLAMVSILIFCFLLRIINYIETDENVLEFDSNKHWTNDYCAPKLGNDYIKNSHSIKQLHIFTRHGDRSPLDSLKDENVSWFDCSNDVLLVNISGSEPRTYEKVAQKNPKRFWEGNCFQGQLTDRGKNQMKNLGRIINEKYLYNENWIDNYPTPNEINIRSTDYWLLK